MKKNIVLFSPVPFNSKFESGISIRINEVAETFANLDLKAVKTDKLSKRLLKKADFLYALISTKPDSITAQILDTLKPEEKLIIDLYTPLLLEKESSRSYYGPLGLLKRLKNQAQVKKILKRGNYFIVANFRQKKYWLKTAQSLGIYLKPNTISVLPTGTHAPPERVIRKPKNIILWFGGIYPWLNPAPLICAFTILASKYPHWRLRIIGARHPDTGYDKIYSNFLKSVANIPKNQVEILSWQDLSKLNKYLEDVSFAVHVPQEGLEDYYSHRVRLLTLLNHGIPIITAGSDIISKLAVDNKAGFKAEANPKSILFGAENLIKNKQKVETFSKNARKIQEIFLKSENVLKDMIII